MNMEDYYRYKMNRNFRVKVDGKLVGWLGLKNAIGIHRSICILLRALDSDKQVFSWNNRVKMYAR